MKSLSVVMCAYNEEQNIARAADETTKVLRSMEIDYELIIVNDGSSDGTGAKLDQLAANDPNIKVITHPVNQGIGMALFNGYKTAQKDLVTILPADGQVSSSDVKMLYDNMNGYDLVVTYYIKRPISILRWLTSKGVRLILFILFGPMPKYEGTYMFERSILQRMPLKMTASFVLNYEFVIRAKRLGCKIKAIPTRCIERASGSSKVLGFKKIYFIFQQIIELRLKHF